MIGKVSTSAVTVCSSAGKGTALRVVVVRVSTATDDEFALVRLADVAVHGVGHYHAVDDRLDRLGNEGLQALALDGHADACGIHDGGDVASGNHADLLGLYGAARRLKANDLVALAQDLGAPRTAG